MDKKKLIGTIIGVIMFAALIAGATFAWLTIAASITNGNYTASTKNFIVNYTSGTAVDTLNILSTPTTNDILVEEGLITVSAYKATGSADGILNLKFELTSESNELITDGAVKYKVCVGTCEGILTADGAIGEGTTTLYTDTLPDTETTYNIYLWLDASIVNSNHIGKELSGYVFADAIQTD